eukprot:SM000048S16602  [mRNA]  locus=s48:593246:596268:- [translate_table: standard]
MRRMSDEVAIPDAQADNEELVRDMMETKLVLQGLRHGGEAGYGEARGMPDGKAVPDEAPALSLPSEGCPPCPAVLLLLLFSPLWLPLLPVLATSLFVTWLVLAVFEPPPITAPRIKLPDGRSVAYREQGLPAHRARHTILVLHGGPDCRLTGIPGIKTTLLEEFGIRLVSYDRPGYGQSDYFPGWSLTSSVIDILELADELKLGDRFWLLGYSGGGPYAWAAAKYIPERLAGIALWAPDGNPWWPSIAANSKVWKQMPVAARFRYLVSRHLPTVLPPWLVPYLIPTWFVRCFIVPFMRPLLLYMLLLYEGHRDRRKLRQRRMLQALAYTVRESLRQGNLQAVYEDLILPTQDWPFDIAELRTFTGPVHVWQGTDDRDVPFSLNEAAVKILPTAVLHALPREGHFSWFCFNDSGHREVLQTLLGPPQGPAVGEASPVEHDLLDDILIDEMED